MCFDSIYFVLTAFANIHLLLLAPNAISNLKAKLKGFLKSKTSGKKEEKPAEVKPTEPTGTDKPAPTETGVQEPAPVAVRKYILTTR